MSDDTGLGSKALMTGIVLVLMVPGLIVEPGPLSEIVGLAAIGGIWGMNLTGGESE